MTSEDICKYAKVEYCRKKDEYKDYHPSQNSIEKLCNVSRCSQRHPQPCGFFEASLNLLPEIYILEMLSLRNH